MFSTRKIRSYLLLFIKTWFITCFIYFTLVYCAWLLLILFYFRMEIRVPRTSWPISAQEWLGRFMAGREGAASGGRGVTTVLPRGGGRPVSVVPSGPAARSQSPRAEREQRERERDSYQFRVSWAQTGEDWGSVTSAWTSVTSGDQPQWQRSDLRCGERPEMSAPSGSGSAQPSAIKVSAGIRVSGLRSVLSHLRSCHASSHL